MSENVIEGLKLIKHNAGGVNLPDDPSFPYKMEMICSPPEFMTMAFIGLFGGSEEVIVRGMTKEALEEFIGKNNYRTHPRLRSLVISGPDGIIEKLPS